MSVVPFPRPPKRAIMVRPFGPTKGHWIGRFIGDATREGFRTEPGPLYLVLDACKQDRVRCGLPIVVGQAVRKVAA
jgi:hypothetical protein